MNEHNVIEIMGYGIFGMIYLVLLVKFFNWSEN